MAKQFAPGARRCKGHSSRTKQPCKNPAIQGGFVCTTHGGSARQVKAKAAQRVRDLLAEAIDPNRWLRECAAIGYFDPREMYDDDGNLLPIKKWPPHVAAAIATVEVMKLNLVAGDGKTDLIMKPRPWSKEKALEMLGKMLGKLKEQVEHAGGVEISWKSTE